ncbi:hypothetical protein AX15_007313 [Amanita polypyramis BW_CC]|nr:hypothetical protein AX15_007313 [Amanita polypyramis BW_CC]
MVNMIPPEIIDLFFEYLHLDRDKRTLGSCSLVCKAWLPIARHHLLSDVTVVLSTFERDDLLEELIPSPLCTIAPYLHTLHIQGSCPALPPLIVQAAIKVVHSLPNIRNITLQDITWPLISTELMDIILSYDLTSLSFSFVFFATSHQLYQLLSAFPRLSTLKLGFGVRWMENNHEAHTSKPLQSVRRLSFDASKEMLMSFLLQSTTPLSIDDLEMWFISSPQKTMVHKFLGRTMPKHLTLDFGKIGQGPGMINFDLSSHLELRSLTLTLEGLILSRSYYHSPEATWTACMALLSSIKSRSLEFLTIGLLSLNSVVGLDWTRLDDLLEGDAFKNLKTVSIKLYVVTDPESQQLPHLKAISTHLPKTRARHLLDFQTIDKHFPCH